MRVRYYNKTINHKFYKFNGNADVYSYIELIPNNEINNYKYCETCDICYKKSYFNSHKTRKFHKTKQNIIDDEKLKQSTESSLSTTIDIYMNIGLKNNDINIGTIICDYLKDTCCDCKEETSNPTILFGETLFGEPLFGETYEMNICQHCRSKYKTCCAYGCYRIGTSRHFDQCKTCKEFGCNDHIKNVGNIAKSYKKEICINCSHNEVDTIFKKKISKNDEIKSLKEQIKKQRDVMKYRVKKLRKNRKEINDLREELARINGKV